MFFLVLYTPIPSEDIEKALSLHDAHWLGDPDVAHWFRSADMASFWAPVRSMVSLLNRRREATRRVSEGFAFSPYRMEGSSRRLANLKLGRYDQSSIRLSLPGLGAAIASSTS